MADQRYEANRETIGLLLSTASPRIEVPEWQRSYSWESSQIEAFWQDLQEFDVRYPGRNIEGEEYFLGSIVVVTGRSISLLLDGQQRLATATILLSVLRNTRRLHKADAATRLQNKYISDFDDATNTTRYVLTLNVYDREFFRSEIQDEPANPPVRSTPTLRSHALIRKARVYFEQQVSKKTEELGGGEAAFQWNLRVSKVLCDHMSVVAVTSADEDNAAAVFETLNDRGIGLSTPDLLRNLLLRRASDDVARQRIVMAWQQVLSIGEEADVDDFLRHYWVSHWGDVKSRKLYREIKATIIDHGVDSLSMSLDLAETAVVYRDLVRARENDLNLRRLLESIRTLGAKALYPALLSGWAAAEGERGIDNVRRLAGALIALFVRYNVIGGRESTVMESRIYDTAAQLRKSRDFDSAITALASLSPDAASFVTQFQRVSINRVATARYILREIEHAKRRTQEMTVEETDRVHVEHIYPQTPEGPKWPSHMAVINRLGNMTLLGKRLNTSIKNADFLTKKDRAYKGSDILMTRELLHFSTWSPAEIEKRQQELSRYVFDIWKFSGEPPPEAAPPMALATEETGTAAIGDQASLAGDVVPEQLPEVPTG